MEAPVHHVPLAQLVDSLLQKAYHDLTVLAELLPRKSDMDRKVEIVQFARRTRLLLIRLLALVKWAGGSTSVHKCTEMSALLSQQSQLYVDSADQLFELSRNTLSRACTPYFSLAPAIDVLTTGSYPRLPTCIKERIVPLPPLSARQESHAHALLNCAIRRRLLHEEPPAAMRVAAISRGLVKFVVPFEFELSLSVVSDDMSSPWRLVSLRVLVGDSVPGRPVLVHTRQQLFLHQVLQSRMVSEDRPLHDCYTTLHCFCLSLQLDCLHTQALRLSEVCGSHMKVEEYAPGQSLKIAYWRSPGSAELLNSFLLDSTKSLSWPRLTVSLDPSSTEHPFTSSHSPPLGEGGEGVELLEPGRLALEALLHRCVACRSRHALSDLLTTLTGNPWRQTAELCEAPLCLKVEVPLKYASSSVWLGVDGRTGQFTASVDDAPGAKLTDCLEELAKSITSSRASLPSQLSSLQCELFLSEVAQRSRDAGLLVRPSLPLLCPLPFHAPNALHIRLHGDTYLRLSVGEGLVDQYHLLDLQPALAAPSEDGLEPPPQCFFTASHCVELDPDRLLQPGSVLVLERGARLKRRLAACSLPLPSCKRLCLRTEPMFDPLPFVVTARLCLLNIQASLEAAGILFHASYAHNGAPVVNVIQFPEQPRESPDLHSLLSSHLHTLTLHPSPTDTHCSWTFSSLTPLVSSESVQHHVIPAASDVGRELLSLWGARLALLGLALELHHYLQDGGWPLVHQCSIAEFSFDKLAVTFGLHKLIISGGVGGLDVAFSEQCPHQLLRQHLVQFITLTRSLPLVLQGLVATEEPMLVLTSFVRAVPAATVSAASPPHIMLHYDHHLTLNMSLQTDSSVLMTDLTHTRSINLFQPQPFLQSFLQSQLVGVEAASADSEDSVSAAAAAQQPVARPVLFPSPSPRVSVGSPQVLPSPQPLPSLPTFPSPGDARLWPASDWSFTATLEQFRTLFQATPTSPAPMESFLGGVSMLSHFVSSIAQLRPTNPMPIQFVQCDRGVYMYRTDTLTLTLSMEGPQLLLVLKPHRESVWAASEVDSMVTFFRTHLLCPPFAVQAMTSLANALSLPIATLKSLVLLMQAQMNPQPTMVWHFSVCLTIPGDNDLTAEPGSPFIPGNSAIIYSRAKLLLFLRMTRAKDGHSFVIPLVHDPKANLTYVARMQNKYRSQLHQPIDQVLRKSSQEHNPSHPSSSLFPALLSLAQTALPL